MASQGQAMFWSMTMVIIILAVVIALIIGFGVSGNRSISVTALTSTGNIGQGGILGCTFEPDIQLGSIEIRWTKAGVAGLVHEFKAFSIPKVHMETSSSGDTLQCEAARWFPQPAVHWTACSDSGKYLPGVANTSYELNTENITLKVVSFLHNITANVTYTCVIENNIAKATGNIKVTDFSIVMWTNLQLVSLNAEPVSSSLPAFHWMLLLPLYLLSL
ncbi:V-set domain-containing T-cell activation inhibitor 1 isoform X2 [Calypte anna]|uniref:V-set domain-containing T-cell activation inhibitor 1 isoform X2 n=1 Tax=Calypte anna TaxID=9244 RepID=UPI0011C44A05|nr:V-set domain-containing T-cell activation inhibitor 1 isoform X2 [Calypte anna]